MMFPAGRLSVLDDGTDPGAFGLGAERLLEILRPPDAWLSVSEE